jgi:hypothetical protein
METRHAAVFVFAALVAALAGLSGGIAVAQNAPRPDPTDPKIASPMPDPRSAYADYRAFADEPLAPWREVNDDVARIGGHAGALKGDATSPGSAPAGAAPAPSRSGASGAGESPGGMHRAHGSPPEKKP